MEESYLNLIKNTYKRYLLYFIVDTIAYVENHKKSTPKKATLKLINEFSSKVIGYKISTQKSIIFLHTNNNYAETNIENTISQLFQRKWNT